MSSPPPLWNLRSDTQSLPTSSMRRAMSRAPVGDDTYREDPTVNELEERVADILGTEAALLVLSGTMANLVAVLVHCRPGDVIFADRRAHLLRSEAGGFAHLGGAVAEPLDGARGHLSAQDVADAVRGPDVHRPRPRLVWFENSANRAGGTVQDPAAQAEAIRAAHDRGLVTHLDGARLWNAAAALSIGPAELVRGHDSVYVDLTKGLACPVGALLAGSTDVIDAARRGRRVVGGGMRQAGVFAACGLVALEEVLPRLPEDHERAQRLGRGLAVIDGIDVELDDIDTNIVFVDVRGLGGSERTRTALEEEGILVSSDPPDHIRMCTYLQIGDEAIAATVRAFQRLAARVVVR